MSELELPDHHTEFCKAIRPERRMGDLTIEQRQTIFDCPHVAHDVARKIWTGSYR